MKFFVDKESLNINFTFRERIKLLFKGTFKLNRKDAYAFSNVLMHIVSKTLEVTGDGKVHGQLEKDKYIKDGS
tara:strand:- start:45 stop:263 length:219 start_codon:yes stop_codon:yes gene_type:complete